MKVILRNRGNKKIMTVIQQIDWIILDLIKNYFHNPFLDKVMILITSLGNIGFIWVLIASILLMNSKYRKIGLMIICALVLSLILGDGILKHLLKRPRPFIADPGISLIIAKPLSYSFPSGHAASAFAAAGILVRTIKKYKTYMIVLAFLIAFSRVYLLVHYPTDVIGGIVLGLICSQIVLYFFAIPDSHKGPFR